MLASLDPAAYVVLALLVVVAVLVVRLRRARRQRRRAAWVMARYSGHPSASGIPAMMTWADRRALASAAEHHLAGLGMVAERHPGAPIVRARGLAGDYVLTVTGRHVLVEYDVTGPRLLLGEFDGLNDAVREIARHAELPSSV